MIYALEGPDRCGKSTVFGMLKQLIRDVIYIDRLPLDAKLVNVMSEVERVQEYLFRGMYDPTKTYILDRSISVSAQVYSELYGRPLLFDPSVWIAEQHVYYIDTPVEVLAQRRDEHFAPSLYEDVRRIYRNVLDKYSWTRVDGLSSPLASVQRIADDILRRRKS